jgi:hypothetical protein
MTATIIVAPREEPHPNARPSIFLAGSIEMGKAEDWQFELTTALADLPIWIFNPRRPVFDVNLRRSKDEPAFREQVEWELTHLARANVIALYFAPGTKSPISLLELGLHAHTGKIICCCPEGFWRKGNVDIVCERWGIPVYERFEEFTAAVVRQLKEKHL